MAALPLDSHSCPKAGVTVILVTLPQRREPGGEVTSPEFSSGRAGIPVQPVVTATRLPDPGVRLLVPVRGWEQGGGKAGQRPEGAAGAASPHPATPTEEGGQLISTAGHTAVSRPQDCVPDFSPRNRSDVLSRPRLGNGELCNGVTSSALELGKPRPLRRLSRMRQHGLGSGRRQAHC